MSEAVQSEFKGSAILILRNSSQDQFPFQFGVRKAKMVLTHIEDIRRFVQTEEAK